MRLEHTPIAWTGAIDAQEIADVTLLDKLSMSPKRGTSSFRLVAVLLASSVALAANMALLSIASAVRINTGQGGLFRLFAMIIHRLAAPLRLMDSWNIFALPFSLTVFHIVTGWMMAIVYALALEPKLPGRPFFKGVAYGTAIWFLNAFVVLPLANEGIAGSRHSNTVGLIVFAIAHMTFFVVLSMLYGFICDRSAR
jgi:hypothetical protein